MHFLRLDVGTAKAVLHPPEGPKGTGVPPIPAGSLWQRKSRLRSRGLLREPGGVPIGCVAAVVDCIAEPWRLRWSGCMRKLERIFQKSKKKTRISFFDLPIIEDLLDENAAE